MKLLQASEEHVDDILAILSPYVRSGIVLPREKNEILSSINDFFVADINGFIVGCIAIKDYSEGLFEIRSLAVAIEHNNKGIGKKLISMAVENIVSGRNPKQIFTLTLRPEVFAKVGFKLASRSHFPKKIWDDCSKCPKFHTCDEVALVYNVR